VDGGSNITNDVMGDVILVEALFAGSVDVSKSYDSVLMVTCCPHNDVIGTEWSKVKEK